jgi:hypothetical protein
LSVARCNSAVTSGPQRSPAELTDLRHRQTANSATVLPKLAVWVRFCFARSLQGATLKVELVGRRRYQTRAEARASILARIAWYNRRRLHSTNGYLSPVEWEHRHATLNPPPSRWAHNPGVRRTGGSLPRRCLVVRFVSSCVVVMRPAQAAHAPPGGAAAGPSPIG